MSVTSDDILQCAERIATNATCEADHRAAIGRAYYAAYHFCHGFHANLPSPGVEPPRSVGGSHAKIIYRLENPTSKDSEHKRQSKSIGYMLNSIRLERVIADYEIHEPVTIDNVKVSVRMAKRICS